MRQLERPRAVLAIAALAFGMSLPAIATDLVTDDYALAAAVARDPWGAFVNQALDPVQRKAAILAERAAGQLPWWVDENFHQSFLRPLSSLSHALDFALWPRAVWWMHVENALLYALVVWLAAAIYRRLGLESSVLGLATLFFAMAGNHATSVAWISGRNTLLATGFGLSAILLQLASAQAAARAPLLQLLAVGALAAGLASAEFAIGALGFLCADALTLRRGPPLARRLLALWPYALLALAWLAWRAVNGYGSIGSAFYHDPAHAPGLFLRGVVTGVPIYLATQLTWPFATFSCFFPGALAIVSVLSLAILYSLRGLFLPLLRRDPRARFLTLGAALSTLPLATTAAQDRLVFMVALGCSGLLALAVSERLGAEGAGLPRRAAGWLFRIHAFYLPLLFVPLLFSTAGAQAVGGGTTALAGVLPAKTRRVVLLNAPSELQGRFQHYIRLYRGQPPLAALDTLYAGAQPVLLRRDTPSSLELSVERGYLAATLERLVRDPDQHPFQAGDVVTLPRMRVTILDVNANAAPTRVRFDFGAVLESLDLDWLVWEGRTPKPWHLPPVGARVHLEPLRPFP